MDNLSRLSFLAYRRERGGVIAFGDFDESVRRVFGGAGNRQLLSRDKRKEKGVRREQESGCKRAIAYFCENRMANRTKK